MRQGSTPARTLEMPEALVPSLGGQRLWRIEAERVEMWQGSTDLRHIRIVYTRTGDTWERTVDRGENAR